MDNLRKNNYIVAGAVLVALAGMLIWRLGFGGAGEQAMLSSALIAELGEAQTYEAFKDEAGVDTGSNFTFSYPKKINITETAIEGVEGGKRILAESTEFQKGFEVIVLPFDENGLLTRDRILQDVPGMVIKNDKEISVGGGISALSFNSTDENIGDTFEIWFTYNGFIYEARTYPDFGPQMTEILKTWKFK